MRRQQAIFNRSPTKDLSLAPLSKTKNRLQLEESDHETLETLSSLTERNFATSLNLVDSSKGEAETEKLKTSIWN